MAKRKRGSTPDLFFMAYSKTEVYDWIMHRKEINLGEKVIYARLIRYMGKNDAAWPGIETLSKELVLGTRTIQRALRNLEKLGLITIEFRDNRSSLYRINRNKTGTAYQWMAEDQEFKLKNTKYPGAKLAPPWCQNDTQK